LKPAQRREMVEFLRTFYQVSPRRASQTLSGPRSTLYSRSRKAEQAPLRRRIKEIASVRVRYGYSRILALLRSDGWMVNHKRLERIWRQEGLKVPQKLPKRSRLWLNDGSCVRRWPWGRTI
jgi:putative transposase